MFTTNKKGFTIVEVLVTVMVLSICLGAVIKGFFSSVNAIQVSEEYIRAIQGMESAMNRMLIENRSVGIPQMAMREGGLEYRLSTSPFPGEPNIKPLHKADLSVAWRSSGKSKQLELSTCLFFPGTSEDVTYDLSKK